MNPELRRVNLELTGKCNYNCTICSYKKRRNNTMKLSDVKDLLDFLQMECEEEGLYLPEIRFFVAGEPSLYEYLAEAIDLAWDFPVLIHTNGSYWDYNLSQKVCNIDHPNLRVSFSLDGGDAESYFQIRGRHSWPLVSTYVRYFCDLIKLVNLETTKVNIQCIADSGLRNTIETKLRLDFPNAHSFDVRAPHNWNVANSVEGAEKKNYGPLCDFMFHDLIMYSDMQVGLCCACLNAEKTFGDIRTDFDYNILKAFNDPKRKAMQLAMKNKKSIDVCDKCERYNK